MNQAFFIPDVDVDYTENGFLCENRCGVDGLFKGRHWCHTFDSWDYCTPNYHGKCLNIFLNDQGCI